MSNCSRADSLGAFKPLNFLHHLLRHQPATLWTNWIILFINQKTTGGRVKSLFKKDLNLQIYLRKLFSLDDQCFNSVKKYFLDQMWLNLNIEKSGFLNQDLPIHTVCFERWFLGAKAYKVHENYKSPQGPSGPKVPKVSKVKRFASSQKVQKVHN